MDVQEPLRYLNQVMICGVSQTIDGLEKERLLVSEELNAPVAQRFPHALVEAYGLFLAWLSYSAAAVHYGGLEEHFECVIENDEYSLDSTPVPRAVEVLKAQN